MNQNQEQLRSKASPLARVLCVVSLALGACSAAAPARSGAGTSTTTGSAGTSAPGQGAQGSCATDNLTANCTCPAVNNAPGRQTCSGGQWSACACLQRVNSAAGTGGIAVDGGTPKPAATGANPVENSSANRFDWQRVPLELGSCKAGHYVGYFDGFYGSPAVFTFPVPVLAVDAPAVDGGAIQPGLEFWLTKVPGSGELFAINGGKMRGSANGTFPFDADLKGTLDCGTKKYNGTIENGVYDDGTGMKYQFIGVMTSDYDKIQNKFINGQWKCTEPTSIFPTAGGSGMWNATWKGP
ncbi:MAG TPA: hypothetical protein VF331_04570 [Polyangiales bacterium]